MEIQVDLEFVDGTRMLVETPTNLGLYPLLNAQQIDLALLHNAHNGLRDLPSRDPKAPWHYVQGSDLIIVYPEIQEAVVVASGLGSTQAWPLRPMSSPESRVTRALAEYLQVRKYYHVAHRKDSAEPWRAS